MGFVLYALEQTLYTSKPEQDFSSRRQRAQYVSIRHTERLAEADEVRNFIERVRRYVFGAASVGRR